MSINPTPHGYGGGFGPPQDAGSRPAITTVGVVEPDGDGRPWPRGWQLGLCAAACPCHRHPGGGHLYIEERPEQGTLGLRCFRMSWCGCCRPWTVAELQAVLRDLADLGAGS